MNKLFEPAGARRGRIGTWIKLGAIESVEIMAFAGFEFVVLDMEHTPLSLSDVYRHIVTASSNGVAPLVRVPDHGASTIQRVLDMGAHGILVPHVDTIEQAAFIASCTRFPPAGRRGSGNTSRAGRWGLLGRPEYLRFGNDEAMCIVQLESREGIENAAEILALPGIDAALVGASDLGLETGLAPDNPELQGLIDHAIDAAKSAGKPVGNAIGSDAKAARKSFGRGFSWVVMSNDLSMLAETARGMVASVRSGQTTGGTV
jgi:2-keto-3-deoxy-L-rhamnonate aldolase RhmA